jgi:hypothetical protein
LVTLHAFLALAAGFAAVMVVALGLRGILLWLVPSMADVAARPDLGYTVVNLGASFLSGAAGGYATAWVATANPLIHVLALALIVLGLAALSALQSRGKQPIWYQLAQVGLSPVGVFVGGMVRLRVMGVL